MARLLARPVVTFRAKLVIPLRPCTNCSNLRMKIVRNFRSFVNICITLSCQGCEREAHQIYLVFSATNIFELFSCGNSGFGKGNRRLATINLEGCLSHHQNLSLPCLGHWRITQLFMVPLMPFLSNESSGEMAYSKADFEKLVAYRCWEMVI